MEKVFFYVLCLILCLIALAISVFGQNVTNNNTITIQGNVYYFQPSTTPSSPPPTQSSGFLGAGEWYGEDAAKAWASIADWVIDHCLRADRAVTGNGNERVYISSVRVVHYEGGRMRMQNGSHVKMSQFITGLSERTLKWRTEDVKCAHFTFSLILLGTSKN